MRTSQLMANQQTPSRASRWSTTKAVTFLALLAATQLLTNPRPASAQQRPISMPSDLTSLPLLRDQLPNVYEFVRTGQPSIRVLVIGSVQNQGYYIVSPETTLEQLILYTGGPSAVGNLRKPDVFMKQVRPEVRFTISRRNGANRQTLPVLTFSDILDGTREIPSFVDEDILLVETEQIETPLIRDVLNVFQTAISIFTSAVVVLYVFGVIERRNI